jgi:hypothetical protein
MTGAAKKPFVHPQSAAGMSSPGGEETGEGELTTKWVGAAACPALRGYPRAAVSRSGYERSAGHKPPGHRRHVPSRPGGPLDFSFRSFGSLSPPGHSALTESSDFWIQDSAFSLRAFAPPREKFGSFCPFCQKIPGPKLPRINLPNSTVDLGLQPLIQVDNGLSHPQFNPTAILTFIEKTPEIRTKFRAQTSYKPPQTKKLNATVELGCRRSAPALPAPAKLQLCFWSSWSFSGAWKLAVGCFNCHQGYPRLSRPIQGYPGINFFSPPFPICNRLSDCPMRSLPFRFFSVFSSHLQVFTGIYRQLQPFTDPPSPRGYFSWPKSKTLILPRFSRHGLSRQITANHALSRVFCEIKRLFIFMSQPNSTQINPPAKSRRLIARPVFVIQ